MNTHDHISSYELVSSHAAPQRGRSRSLAGAGITLAIGALVLVAVSLNYGKLGLGNSAASLAEIRERDSLLGGPPAPKHAAPPASHMRSKGSALIAHSAATPALTQSLVAESPKILFDVRTADPQIAAYVESGHMKCCVRDNHDLEKEVYPKYYDDFPMDPMCIPGYHMVAEDCIACDAGRYCPSKDDLIYRCPPMTHSPMASGEATSCWCELGWYGVDASMKNGANCHPCPADKFCPGACLCTRPHSGTSQNAAPSPHFPTCCCSTLTRTVVPCTFLVLIFCRPGNRTERLICSEPF
jgi:hypothetical protein